MSAMDNSSAATRRAPSVPRTFKSDSGLQATVAPAPDNLGGFECPVHDADNVLVGVKYFDSETAADMYALFAVQS